MILLHFSVELHHALVPWSEVGIIWQWIIYYKVCYLCKFLLLVKQKSFTLLLFYLTILNSCDQGSSPGQEGGITWQCIVLMMQWVVAAPLYFRYLSNYISCLHPFTFHCTKKLSLVVLGVPDYTLTIFYFLL